MVFETSVHLDLSLCIANIYGIELYKLLLLEWSLLMTSCGLCIGICIKVAQFRYCPSDEFVLVLSVLV